MPVEDTMNTPASQPPYQSDVGEPRPLGATLDKDKGGVNFSLFSEHATGVTLLLFDPDDPSKVSQEIPLSVPQDRTHYYWHVFVRDLKAGLICPIFCTSVSVSLARRD
jgi:glycogen operon protein